MHGHYFALTIAPNDVVETVGENVLADEKLIGQDRRVQAGQLTIRLAVSEEASVTGGAKLWSQATCAAPSINVMLECFPPTGSSWPEKKVVFELPVIDVRPFRGRKRFSPRAGLIATGATPLTFD